mgnify:CR=1 FL=1
MAGDAEDGSGNDPPDPDGPIQFAAGGLLRRADDRLAVVHRPRYDDWSLPKGKPEPGESLAATAARELREETGCDVVLGSFAGRYGYVADGPKAVLLWHAVPVELGAFEPGDEVDDLAWLPPTEAVARLTYPNERALVRRVLVDSPR